MTSRKIVKTFSKEEAEALIPELEKKIKDLRAKKEFYGRIHDSLFMRELLSEAEKAKGFLAEPDDLEVSIFALEESIEALVQDIEEIVELGCFLRNIEKGIVEFPAVLNSGKVFLSWKIGEKNITHFRLPKSSEREKIV